MTMTTPNEPVSFSEIQSALPQAMGDEKIPVIPDRMYFRIGDVAEIAGVQPYVLRFWEKEFDFLAPIKNSAGQRLYRKGDVESVLLIKRLLYLERYSIEGAKKRIKEMRKTGGLSEAKRERAVLDDHRIDCIRSVKEELRALIEFL
jgi:DNA-binding transcriptional MerR regulator